MQVIPAIDIMGKKCVRLTRGDFSSSTVFSASPAKTAAEFVAQGAKLVHVIDLDGAKSGKLVNFDILDQLSYICLMEIGGGIRTIESVNKVLSIASTPIISTAAVEDEKFLAKLAPFKAKVAIALDSKAGKLATRGWAAQSSLDTYEFAAKAQNYCKRIIFTAIERDGAMEGPDIVAIKEMRKCVKSELFVAGGMSTLDDIKAVKSAGADGCIIGKALYLGKISLKDAIKAGK